MRRWYVGIAIVSVSIAMEGYGKDRSAEPEVLVFEPQIFTAGAEGLPEFVKSVGYEQGQVGGVTSAWSCAADQPVAVGKLWMDIDRSKMDEDLAMTLLYGRDPSSDVAVQLWDDQGRVVALDLFKNVMSIATLARTDTLIVPLRKYPSASRIMLRRVSGDVKLYGVILMPVISEEPGELDDLLELTMLFGDPLSPENEFLKRVLAVREKQRTPSISPEIRRDPVRRSMENAGQWSHAERETLLGMPANRTNRLAPYDRNILGAGGAGLCMEFDGQHDYVEIADDASLRISGAITLLARFRLDPEGDATHYMITDKMGMRPYEGYRIYATKDGFNEPVDGKVSLFFALDLGGGETGDIHLCARNAVRLGETHHIAAAYDGKMMKIYLDGHLAASMSAGGTIVTGAAPLYIGRNAYGWHWRGTIGDVDVIDHALTAEEVAARIYGRQGTGL